jgi:hypothetical protein
MQFISWKTGLKLSLLITSSVITSASIAGDLYYLGSPNPTVQIDKPGFKPTLGYQLSPSFAIEGGSTDSKSTGMNVAGVGLVPVSEQFSLFGKVGYTLGVTRTNWGWSGLSLNSSPEKSSMGMGLGGIYQISPKLGFRAEFEKLDSEINQITLGLQARF